MVSFEQIAALNDYEIESIANRHASFGRHLLDAIESLPKFEIYLGNVSYIDGVTINDKCIELDVAVKMLNFDVLRDYGGGFLRYSHVFVLLVADDLNNLLNLERIKFGVFLI